MSNFVKQWASIDMARVESEVISHIIKVCRENNVTFYHLHDSYTLEGEPDDVKRVSYLLHELFMERY